MFQQKWEEDTKKNLFSIEHWLHSKCLWQLKQKGAKVDERIKIKLFISKCTVLPPNAKCPILFPDRTSSQSLTTHFHVRRLFLLAKSCKIIKIELELGSRKGKTSKKISVTITSRTGFALLMIQLIKRLTFFPVSQLSGIYLLRLWCSLLAISVNKEALFSWTLSPSFILGIFIDMNRHTDSLKKKKKTLQ